MELKERRVYPPFAFRVGILLQTKTSLTPIPKKLTVNIQTYIILMKLSISGNKKSKKNDF